MNNNVDFCQLRAVLHFLLYCENFFVVQLLCLLPFVCIPEVVREIEIVDEAYVRLTKQLLLRLLLYELPFSGHRGICSTHGSQSVVEDATHHIELSLVRLPSTSTQRCEETALKDQQYSRCINDAVPSVICSARATASQSTGY